MNAMNDVAGRVGRTRGEAREAWRRPKRHIRFRLNIGLVVADAFALVLATMPVLWFGTEGLNQGLTVITAISPLFFLAAFGGNAYGVQALARRAISVAFALRALALATTMVLFIAFYLKTSETLSRAAIAISVTSAAMTLTIGRLAVDAFARRLLGDNPWQVITICDGVVPSVPTDFMVFIDSQADGELNDSGARYRERFAMMVEGADRVVVLCDSSRRAAWTSVLRGSSVQGEIIHDELACIAPVGIADYRGMPTLVITQGPLSFRDRLFKRMLDLTVSSAAIVVLLPLLAASAIAVRLQDKGPILFHQPRLGRDNKTFNIYKFRTMRVASGDAVGTRSTARDDDRVTRVGRFLRASSFDELPQLFNVLRGQMSIVGPRPHALGSTAEELLFWHVDERYWYRHAIKPGMTGLAQVRGFRGATHVRADLTNRLQSDLEYTVGWTIWRDLLIILRTCGVVFHRNAF